LQAPVQPKTQSSSVPSAATKGRQQLKSAGKPPKGKGKQGQQPQQLKQQPLAWPAQPVAAADFTTGIAAGLVDGSTSGNVSAASAAAPTYNHAGPTMAAAATTTTDASNR
jgi:hypothetical protein